MKEYKYIYEMNVAKIHLQGSVVVALIVQMALAGLLVSTRSSKLSPSTLGVLSMNQTFSGPV